MDNRKYALVVFLVITVSAAGAVFLGKGMDNSRKPVPVPSREAVRLQPVPRITLVIDDGDRVSTYSGVEASDAFTALTEWAEAQGIPVVTKKYDFGVFVESVGGKKSTARQAWIYFVNGASGDVAADRRQVAPGDRVEWRYLAPR